LPIDRFECLTEHELVAFDQRATEFALRREMVVEAGLRDLELLRDVSVAEAVEPSRLNEPFRDVEDPLLRRCLHLRGFPIPIRPCH
jgi:hypothetical protein